MLDILKYTVDSNSAYILLKERNGAFKRGEAPLFITNPIPISRGRGVKGDGVTKKADK